MKHRVYELKWHNGPTQVRNNTFDLFALNSRKEYCCVKTDDRVGKKTKREKCLLKWVL